MSVIAKSVVLDIADLFGGSFSYMSVRRVEFSLGGSVIPVTSGFTAYATTAYDSNYQAGYAFNTSLSKIGSWTNNAWVASNGSITNQRLIIVFTTPITFDSIIINNGHSGGLYTGCGVENVKITISTDAITNTTYNASITNSQVLFNGVFRQHIASDSIDDEILSLMMERYFSSSGGAVAGGLAVVEFDLPSQSLDILVVAGGGGGGNASYAGGGGGGAGGLIYEISQSIPCDSYAVVVGDGGAGSTSNSVKGSSGENSSIVPLFVAVGGGGGGSYDLAAADGLPGGSGGGAGYGIGYSALGGAGTSAQGYAGANNNGSGGTGGGGAAGLGGTYAGNGSLGGVGISVFGTIYSTGGDGNYQNILIPSRVSAGSPNTGDGGDGGAGASSPTGKNGGSGIVIVRYSGTGKCTGGTVTELDGYTYHTFVSDGTLEVLSGMFVDGSGGGVVGGEALVDWTAPSNIFFGSGGAVAGGSSYSIKAFSGTGGAVVGGIAIKNVALVLGYCPEYTSDSTLETTTVVSVLGYCPKYYGDVQSGTDILGYCPKYYGDITTQHTVIASIDGDCPEYTGEADALVTMIVDVLGTCPGYLGETAVLVSMTCTAEGYCPSYYGESRIEATMFINAIGCCPDYFGASMIDNGDSTSEILSFAPHLPCVCSIPTGSGSLDTILEYARGH